MVGIPCHNVGLRRPGYGTRSVPTTLAPFEIDRFAVVGVVLVESA
jgi:hypothetical protein